MWFETLIVSLAMATSAQACFVDVSQETHGWNGGSTNVISPNDKIYFLNLKDKQISISEGGVVVSSKDEDFIFKFNHDDIKHRFVKFLNMELHNCK